LFFEGGVDFVCLPIVDSFIGYDIPTEEKVRGIELVSSCAARFRYFQCAIEDFPDPLLCDFAGEYVVAVLVCDVFTEMVVGPMDY
jgi:hypothetical protein